MAVLHDVKEMKSSPTEEGEYLVALQVQLRGRNSHLSTASSAVVDGGSVTGLESTSDPGKRKETDREEREEREREKEEGGTSRDDVRVHVEAVVGGLELVLYSYGGGVAEVKVKGTSCPCMYMYL